MADIVGARLEKLIQDRRTSQSALARELGISQPTIGRLISGDTRETGKIIELARALQTTPEYLIGETDDDGPGARVVVTGTSDMRSGYRAEPAAEVRSDTVELAEFNVSYGMGGSYIHDADVRSRLRTFSRAWIRQFSDSPFDHLFWATSNGISMMPAILDHDILLIDTMQKTPRMWDQFWAIDMHGMGMIKALRPAKDGAMRILSINPDWPEEIAHDGEMNVIGRVVAIVRKV